LGQANSKWQLAIGQANQGILHRGDAEKKAKKFSREFSQMLRMLKAKFKSFSSAVSFGLANC